MTLSERLHDSPRRYGVVTRLLHWVAAYLLLWQFATLIGWRWLGDGTVMRAVSQFGPAHGTVGVLVLALLAPRLAWTIRERVRRPPREAGLQSRLAATVHTAFYGLMLLVPGLALVRAYGTGKGYEMWNVGLVPATGVRADWLTRPADLLHGPLAWTLAALIGLHAAAALFHALVRRDGVLTRMTGRLHVSRRTET